MASSTGERTEKPTPKRQREARRDGQIPRTPDVGTWAGVLAATVLLPLVVERGGERMLTLMAHLAEVVRAPEPAGALALLGEGASGAVYALGPLLLGMLAVGVLAHAVQGGVPVSSKLLRPKFSRLNPAAGLKRLLGPQGMWELVKVVVKTAVLALVVWRGLAAVLPALTKGGVLPLSTTLAVVSGAALRLMRDVAVIGLVLAVADYGMARRRINKSIRMSLRDIKDEHKQAEGDPQMKGAMRSRQLAVSRNRMMAEVASADVVVVNPIHVAVALKYDPARGAPRVVAKGAGVVAARIRAEAETHRVPMIEDVPLARALHKACELGQEIPAELYTAVAHVLAFVLSLKARGSAAGVHRPPTL